VNGTAGLQQTSASPEDPRRLRLRVNGTAGLQQTGVNPVLWTILRLSTMEVHYGKNTTALPAGVSRTDH
jgi:hypothetical protein